MKTHILTALMAVFLSACASHHRDVASVQDEQQDYETRTEQARADMVSPRGESIR